MNLQTLTDETHNLGNLMMGASAGKLRLFTVVGIYDEETNHNLAVTKDWTGEPDTDPKARPPVIARYKLAQVLTVPKGTELALSPVVDLGLGPDFDYAGAVMKLVNGMRYVVAASAQSAQTDLMVSSTLMYSMEHDTRFNHIGLTFGTVDELEQAVSEHEERYKVKGFRSTSGTDKSFHYRSYIPVRDERAPDGEWFIELRWFPERDNISPEIHFDLVTAEPDRLLGFAAHCLGVEPEMWDDADPGTPVGMVSVFNRDHHVAIMARDRWFDPR